MWLVTKEFLSNIAFVSKTIDFFVDSFTAIYWDILKMRTNPIVFNG